MSSIPSPEIVNDKSLTWTEVNITLTCDIAVLMLDTSILAKKLGLQKILFSLWSQIAFDSTVNFNLNFEASDKA